MTQCPKCGAYSGDDWEQCEGACPMAMSPHYKKGIMEMRFTGIITIRRCAKQLNEDLQMAVENNNDVLISQSEAKEILNILRHYEELAKQEAKK